MSSFFSPLFLIDFSRLDVCKRVFLWSSISHRTDFQQPTILDCWVVCCSVFQSADGSLFENRYQYISTGYLSSTLWSQMEISSSSHWWHFNCGWPGGCRLRRVGHTMMSQHLRLCSNVIAVIIAVLPIALHLLFGGSLISHLFYSKDLCDPCVVNVGWTTVENGGNNSKKYLSVVWNFTQKILMKQKVGCGGHPGGHKLPGPFWTVWAIAPSSVLLMYFSMWSNIAFMMVGILDFRRRHYVASKLDELLRTGVYNGSVHIRVPSFKYLQQKSFEFLRRLQTMSWSSSRSGSTPSSRSSSSNSLTGIGVWIDFDNPDSLQAWWICRVLLHDFGLHFHLRIKVSSFCFFCIYTACTLQWQCPLPWLSSMSIEVSFPGQSLVSINASILWWLTIMDRCFLSHTYWLWPLHWPLYLCCSITQHTLHATVVFSFWYYSWGYSVESRKVTYISCKFSAPLWKVKFSVVRLLESATNTHQL